MIRPTICTGMTVAQDDEAQIGFTITVLCEQFNLLRERTAKLAERHERLLVAAKLHRSFEDWEELTPMTYAEARSELIKRRRAVDDAVAAAEKVRGGK